MATVLSAVPGSGTLRIEATAIDRHRDPVVVVAGRFVLANDAATSWPQTPHALSQRDDVARAIACVLGALQGVPPVEPAA
jgi:hypothetical protein